MGALARTASGDVALPLRITTDPIAITQNKIQDALGLWLGSWAFDVNQGFPWLTRVFARKNPSIAQTTALIRKAISLLPRVIEVRDASVAFGSSIRNLAYGMSVRIDTGAVVPVGGSPFIVGQ